MPSIPGPDERKSGADGAVCAGQLHGGDQVQQPGRFEWTSLGLVYEYPGVLIYAMAAYFFYAVIIAATNVVKFRRHGSPILSAAKAINLVAAMVSILSLETAMLAQFGSDNDM